MIAFLEGQLFHKSASSAVVMTGGVGYEVFMPLSSFYDLPDEGAEVQFYIKTIVREDDLQLFGFLTRAEKEAFLLLNSVSKIGPRLALNILSGITPSELVAAISQKNTTRLSSIVGVGQKTAERLILELKDKVAELAAEGAELTPDTAPLSLDQVDLDVVSALTNLGYRRQEAEKAVSAARSSMGEEVELPALLRQSLKRLQKV